MTDGNRRQEDENQQSLNYDALDRELDATLAKFTMVEPRAGLEERILANLRAQQEHTSTRVWWRWPALVVAAAMMIVAAVSLVWRSEKPAPDAAVHRPTNVQSASQAGTPIAANNNAGPFNPVAATVAKRPARLGVHHSQSAVVSGPRLGQFPSPRPLSEEEKLLRRYVQDFPQEAVMIAKEQAEFEQQMEKLGGDQAPGANSDQQER
jgi:hypothetical protein